MAKAAIWTITDAQARKHGERKGLDTPVVQAVNVAHKVSEDSTPSEPKLTR